eukprot:2950095-Amphidinium_carterae.1
MKSSHTIIKHLAPFGIPAILTIRHVRQLGREGQSMLDADGHLKNTIAVWGWEVQRALSLMDM